MPSPATKPIMVPAAADQNTMGWSWSAGGESKPVGNSPPGWMAAHRFQPQTAQMQALGVRCPSGASVLNDQGHLSHAPRLQKGRLCTGGRQHKEKIKVMDQGYPPC